VRLRRFQAASQWLVAVRRTVSSFGYAQLIHSRTPRLKVPLNQNKKTGRAWSRRRKKIFPFCDRPGCYEPRREACRCSTKYCGDECRQACKRVLDRERKWLRRKELEENSSDGCQSPQEPLASGPWKCSSANWNPAHRRTPVVDYRSCEQNRVSFLDSDFQPLEEPDDDRETSFGARSRAPPS